jgi:hypothetical protein
LAGSGPRVLNAVKGSETRSKDEAAELGGPEEPVRSIQSRMGRAAERPYSLSKFCSSPSVISGDSQVSRLEIIRYVANKLGGVHFDTKRGKWTNPLQSRYLFLDEMHLRVGRLPAAYFEALSITQSIAQADDSKKLIDRVRELFPEEADRDNKLSIREGRLGKYADFTFGPPVTEDPAAS